MGMKPRKQPEQAALRIEYWSIDDLAPLDTNPKNHELPSIIASIKRFGFRDPVEADDDGVLNVGHGRIKALVSMRDAGGEPPHGVVVDDGGAWSLPVVRGALPFPDDRERDAYVIANNQTTIAGGFDRTKLQSMLGQFGEADALSMGFGEAAFSALVKSPTYSELLNDESGDIVPPKKATTKVGQLWELGRHRLLCGDCRNATDMQRLMQGEKYEIAITSPPYAAQRAYDTASDFKPVLADDYGNWWERVQENVAAHMLATGSFFVNIKEHCEDGQRHLYVKELVVRMVREWGWRFIDEFCWYHNGTPRQVKQRFKNAWEPIFQFTRSSPHKFRPDNVRRRTGAESPAWGGMHPSKKDGTKGVKDVYRGTVSDVQGQKGVRSVPDTRQIDEYTDGWAYPSNAQAFGKNAEKWGHGAAFGVGLPGFFIQAYTDRGYDRVFDPFMGSGTTIIAADRLERIGYGMEVSPSYCDVIVERWQSETGGKAKRRKVR